MFHVPAHKSTTAAQVAIPDELVVRQQLPTSPAVKAGVEGSARRVSGELRSQERASHPFSGVQVRRGALRLSVGPGLRLQPSALQPGQGHR